MGQYLLFRDHKAFVVTDDWDADAQKTVYDEREESGSLVPYLAFRVEIGRNFAFGDLWARIARSRSTLNRIFQGVLTCDLAQFCDEATKPYERTDTPEGGIMTHLRVGWRAERHPAMDGEPGSFDLWVEFDGVGTVRDDGKDESTHFALDMTPVNELMGYPLQLDQSIVVTDWTKGEQPQEEPLGNRSMTLFDVIYGVFDEIGFHGDPTERNQRLAELTQQTIDIDAGKAELLSSDDVFAELRRLGAEKEERDKTDAPALLEQYQKLLDEYRDAEALPVKRFFMENRGNRGFRTAAEQMHKPFLG